MYVRPILIFIFETDQAQIKLTVHCIALLWMTGQWLEEVITFCLMENFVRKILKKI